MFERKKIMTTITIDNIEYKIEYGFNSFADTDLLENVEKMMHMFSESGAKNDADVSTVGMIKDLFLVTRELLYVGLEMHNPAPSVKEVGNMLDRYHKGAAEGEDRGITALFTLLGEELMAEGFFKDLMLSLSQNVKSIPQDHKKSTKTKKATNVASVN